MAIRFRNVQTRIMIHWHMEFTPLWVTNHSPIFNVFPHRCDVASLSTQYHYFHVKYSDELHSVISPRHIITPRTRQATYILVNQPHCLRIQSLWSKFHPGSFFRLITASWNRLPTGCFRIITILTCSKLGLAVIFHSYAKQ